MLSLFHLFRGKKYNVLRTRVDTAEYTIEQVRACDGLESAGCGTYSEVTPLVCAHARAVASRNAAIYCQCVPVYNDRRVLRVLRASVASRTGGIRA